MNWVRASTAGGAAVVSVLVCLAMSASAVATPGSLEWGECTKVGSGGKFANSGCTKAAKVGKEAFEWAPLGTTVPFTGKKKTETPPAVIETSSGLEVGCSGQKTTAGEYGPASKETTNIVEVFTGCETSGFKCKSLGGDEGEIVFNKLRGVAGIITPNAEGKEEKDIVGVDFKPQSSTNVAEFQCGAHFVVRGGVIAQVPVNKMLHKLVLPFVSEKPGKQVPEGFFGGPKEMLETDYGLGFEQSSFSLVTVLTNTVKAQKVELRHCEMNVC